MSQSRGIADRFYHYDGLGSTRALSDGVGAFTDTYDYEAFGEVLNQTGQTENSYLFTGEQFDSSLNQYYLRARYYDQGVGRFTQMDTWQGNNFDPVTLHKYLYANADPVRYSDPTGQNASINSLAVLGLAVLGTASVYSSYQLLTDVSFEGQPHKSQLEFLIENNNIQRDHILNSVIDDGERSGASANDDVNDDTDIECLEWFTDLVGHWIYINERSVSADLTILKKQWNQQAATFLEFCPEFIDRLPPDFPI